MWLIYALLSALSAALVAIFGKLGLKNIDPTLATTIRSIIMVFFLIVVSVSMNKWQGFNLNSLSSKDWWLIVLSGVAGAVSWLFYFYALKGGLATKVAVIDRLSIVFVIIMAVLILGEAFSWKTAAGVLMIVGGAIIISLS